jgi:amidase
MGVYGPLARSVTDLQLCFSLIVGPDGRRSKVSPISVAPEPEQASLQQQRFAWSDQFGEATPTADTIAALNKAIAALQDHGAHVERLEPTLDLGSLWQTWGEIAAAEIAGPMPFVYRYGRWLQLLLMQDSSPGQKGMMRGIRLSRQDLARAQAQRDEFAHAVDRLLEPFDAWLCPVTRAPAFTHRKPGKDIQVDGRPGSYFSGTAGYTTPFSLSGQPVVVIPIGLSNAGLPIGIQVVGRRWQDERLLNVAQALDEVMGNLQTPPGC